jgi:hypothetical protein
MRDKSRKRLLRCGISQKWKLFQEKAICFEKQRKYRILYTRMSVLDAARCPTILSADADFMQVPASFAGLRRHRGANIASCADIGTAARVFGL